jgi:hypothetical protein
MLAYIMDILYSLRPIGIVYAYWVYFKVIWYIFPNFGMLYQEKSGNPAEREPTSFARLHLVRLIVTHQCPYAELTFLTQQNLSNVSQFLSVLELM